VNLLNWSHDSYKLDIIRCYSDSINCFENTDALYHRARNLFFLADFEASLSDVSRAIDINGDIPSYNILLADLNVLKFNFGKSYEILNRIGEKAEEHREYISDKISKVKRIESITKGDLGLAAGHFGENKQLKDLSDIAYLVRILGNGKSERSFNSLINFICNYCEDKSIFDYKLVKILSSVLSRFKNDYTLNRLVDLLYNYENSEVKNLAADVLARLNWEGVVKYIEDKRFIHERSLSWLQNEDAVNSLSKHLLSRDLYTARDGTYALGSI